MKLRVGRTYRFLPNVHAACWFDGGFFGFRTFSRARFVGAMDGRPAFENYLEDGGEGTVMVRFVVDLSGYGLGADDETFFPAPTYRH